jgi:hypothetical protein
MEEMLYLDESWVLLVPATSEEIDQWLKRHPAYGENYKEEYEYVLLQGKKKYSAIACNRGGSIGSERDLAADLSRHFEGRIYALLFEEEYSGDHISIYEKGVVVESNMEYVWDFAKEYLGYGLPGAPSDPDINPVSVIVVEDVFQMSSEMITHIFGTEKNIIVEPVKIGIKIYKTAEDIRGYGNKISELFHDHRVFVVILYKDGDFLCRVTKNYETVGCFDDPYKGFSYFPVLDDIDGHKTKEDVMKYLEIAPGN